MGQPNQDGESKEQIELQKRYKELCADLNLDKTAAEEAWKSFVRIGSNYSLEGNKLHWLACALYVACRKGVTPTVGRSSYVEGNCVSVPRLLRSCKLNLVEFFNKMKKWTDMANISMEMTRKINRLECHFNVTTNIFRKYRPIFNYIFKDPNSITNEGQGEGAGAPGASNPPQVGKGPGGKRGKQIRKLPVSSLDIFQFCWTLYVLIKANHSKISDDLVNSYHLLLACLEFCYVNALLNDNAKNLLNPTFPELPQDWDTDRFVPPDTPPSIIDHLCEVHDGISMEAKCIKEHWFKPFVKRLVEKGEMKCRNVLYLTGFFDRQNYDTNYKNIMKEYDTYVLNIGDFDERIFLSNTAHIELGTPADEATQDHIGHQIRNLQQHIAESKSLTPSTPLSNRHLLVNRDLNSACKLTPISNATQNVGRLQSLLMDREDKPSELLDKLFSECNPNPRDQIIKRVKEISDRFVECYCRPLDGEEQPSSLAERRSAEFAQKRAQLGTSLYYKVLEKIIERECHKLPADKRGEHLTDLLNRKYLHISLFACCLEIVLFSYNAKRCFPWILDCVFRDFNPDLHLHAFQFYKVIELIVREEDGLPREAVKHLNSIEEQILESLAWKADSPIWDLIKSNNGSVPSCQDTALSSSPDGTAILSPTQRTNPFVSPVPQATSTYSTPNREGTKRRLFQSDSANPSSQMNGSSNAVMGQLVQIQLPTQMENGEIRMITVPAYALPAANQNQNNATSAASSSSETETQRPRLGPLGLFMRKVYFLAGLRFNELWGRLSLNDEEERRKIWTLFEYVIREKTELMRDRHLDQMMMCSIYAVCKILKKEQSFTEVMKHYRHQPQAASHVYRSVLITSRRRRDSGSSEHSRASGSSSPVSEDRMRSTSTLPVPHPNSQPPTPTKLAGSGNFFDDEERGDLILFYNKVFVPEVKKFVVKFSPARSDSPPLSPLPKLKATPMSPFRRAVSTKHAVYVSPLKVPNFPSSPSRPMTYSLLRSPAKDLQRINSMIRGSAKPPCVRTKLNIDEVDGVENSPSKRFNNGSGTPSKICNLISNLQSERQGVVQAANGALPDNNEIIIPHEVEPMDAS